MSSKFYVPRSEYEAELAELRRLEAQLNSLREKLTRIETEEYNPLWRVNVRLARRIRDWEARLREYEARLAELRRIGWVYLHRRERTEYQDLLYRLIPRARTRLEELHEAQEKVIAELWRITEELASLREEIASLEARIKEVEEEIRRKVVVELRRVELNAYIIIQEGEKHIVKDASHWRQPENMENT